MSHFYNEFHRRETLPCEIQNCHPANRPIRLLEINMGYNKLKYLIIMKHNRSTEGCSKLKRSVDMTSSEKNGLNIITNASPEWDRTRCSEE